MDNHEMQGHRMQEETITKFERESLRIYTLSENSDPTPAFAFQFYVPHLVRWAVMFVVGMLIFAWVAPSGPTFSLKTTIIVCELILFGGIIVWHVRLAYTAVSHWQLMRRVLDWETIHRLCDLHDANTRKTTAG